jgi:hypothetical protein
MSVITAPLGAIGLLAIAYLAATSQAIRSTAALAREAPQFLNEPLFAVLSFYFPLIVGVTLALVLVWYYWGWILKEKIE